MTAPAIRQFSASSFRYLAFIALWVLVWWSATLMEYQPFISLWFPPAGLSLAAFILMGTRAFLPILMASLIVGMWMYLQLDSALPYIEQAYNSLMLALSHTLAYGIGGLYFRQTVGKWDIQQLPQRILYFLVVTMLTTLLAAWLGIGAFLFIDGMDWVQASDSWINWWVGDLAGAVVLTPFFILILSRLWNHDISWLRPTNERRASDQRKRPMWSHKITLMLVLVGLVIIADHHYEHPAIAYFILFISIPQMWIVFTERMEQTVFSLALVSVVIALWFGFYGVDEHALTYQFAMCVVAANAYFGLAVPSLLNQNRRLHHQTQIDALTHVATRAHFIEIAEAKLQGQRSNDFPLALIVFDLDQFKNINDTHGHLIGDQALIMAAQSVRTHIRNCDLIARFGGDEFLILLPEQNLAQATTTAERLRHSLPAIPTPKGLVPIKASFGIVEIQAHESINEALQRADQALLEAKRKGRDQVVSS
ncbi:sensor domain-containing diguanylate cyclase [Pseudidiomarina homiensis]|uniref:diguanylate cyclase n=1 Tax=Pseudidiomarina homiensis TaxID=364198 RepID=A0A432Y781_9GAMM|nr:diguanylate cyclase [Pseudidiomarina homiensis]RUO56803.1 sensor domain-containing diguanylate cyclase [Pseudidiomarina homiensis]